MKKKLIAIAMLAAVALSSFAVLTGCGGSDPEPESQNELVSSQGESKLTEELTAEDLRYPVPIVKGDIIDSAESVFSITPQEMANRINFSADYAFSTANKEDGSVWLNDDIGNSIVITPCEEHPIYTASVMFIAGDPDGDYFDDAADCIGAAILGTDTLETSDVYTHIDIDTYNHHSNNTLTSFTVFPR